MNKPFVHTDHIIPRKINKISLNTNIGDTVNVSNSNTSLNILTRIFVYFVIDENHTK